MAVTEVHPGDEELVAFTLGTLGEAAQATVEAHVAACTSCQERAAVAPGDFLIDLLRSTPAVAATASQVPTTPPLAAADETATLAPTETDPPEASGAVPPELAGHDRYRVVRLLGEGGMGCVYEAEHRVMQRPVALKVINRTYTASPASVERFRREVRAAARLAHANIVSTYDAEDAGATLFLVMEYVVGISLARLVEQRGPLPVADACDYVRQAALGLQHAHERGMVHRDVKPDNLMLVASPGASAPGVVKVVDFGLAALRGEGGGGLTEANVIMGTPDYMAPEQAVDARSADIRADVYSLGCTLYYVLTGNVPYPAPTPILKILAHREQPVPSIRQARPDVPPELARVGGRLLAKKPEDRLQTPAEVAAALAPFADAKRQPAKRAVKRGWLVAAAALFFLVAGIVVYRIQTDQGVLEITTAGEDVEVVIKQGGKLVDIIDTKTKKRLTLRSGVYDLELKGGQGLKLDITKAVLTRGDTVLATIERLPIMAKIETRPQAVPPPIAVPNSSTEKVGEVRQFVGHSNEIHPVAFSPDGRIVLTGACVDTSNSPGDCSVQLWDPATGKEIHRLTGHRAGIKCAAFSRDGKRVVAGGYWPDPSVTVWDVESGQVLNRFRHTAGAPAIVYGVAFSKDGRHVFSCGTEDGAKRGSSLRMWNLETNKEEKNRFDERASCRGLAVSHGGRLLACCPHQDAAAIRLWDIETGKVIKQFARNKKEEGDINTIAFSPDDSQLVSGDYDFGIRLWDIQNGKDLRRFEGEAGQVYGVAISKEGRRAACGNGKTVELWDLETGKKIHRFTGHSRGILSVAFSPDGRFLLSSGGADNTARLWRLPEAPRTEANKPLAPPQPVVTDIRVRQRVPIQKGLAAFMTTVAPDGKLFAASFLMPEQQDVVIVWDGQTGNEVQRLRGWGCAFSPDHKKFVAIAGDVVSVYDTAAWERLYSTPISARVGAVRMSPNSRYCLLGANEGKTAFLFDLDEGAVVKTWQGNAELYSAWMTDGNTLFLKTGAKHVAWDVRNNKPLDRYTELAKYHHIYEFLPGDTQAYVGDQDGKNFVVNVEDGKIVAPLPAVHGTTISGSRGSADCRVSLVAYESGKLVLLDRSTVQERAVFQLPNGEKPARDWTISMSPEGRNACVASDRAVYLLRLVAAQ